MPTTVDIAIVGGGPGGAAAANAIRRAAPHLTTRIYERAPNLNRSGAFIGISTNGFAALEAIAPECRAAAERAAAPVADSVGYTAAGEEIRRTPAGTSGFRLAAWYKVQTGLLDLLPPGTLHLGCDLQGISVNGTDLLTSGGFDIDGVGSGNGVELRFQGQDEPVHAKLVIGCDGNQSKVRRALLGDGPPSFVKSATWRGVTPMPAEWPYRDNQTSWFGSMPKPIVVVARLGDGSVAWHVGARWGEERLAELGDGRYIGGSTGKGTVEDRQQRCLAAMGPEFPEALVDLIRSTDPNAITEHGMFCREADACKVWGKGPITLLGDAAHLGTPALGQGLNMALEDAVELGRAIGEHGPTEAALREYERVRLPRANAVQAASVKLARDAVADVKDRLNEVDWHRLNPWVKEFRPEPLRVAQRAAT